MLEELKKQGVRQCQESQSCTNKKGCIWTRANPASTIPPLHIDTDITENKLKSSQLQHGAVTLPLKSVLPSRAPRIQATITTLNIRQERVSRARKMTHGRVNLATGFMCPAEVEALKLRGGGARRNGLTERLEGGRGTRKDES